MAIDNVLRISVRIDLTVGEMPVAMADLSLPAGSSLAEILDEILELTGAPQISRPWVARTAAGSPIDTGIPLSRTQLEQGGVLILSPERDLPAPVIRDAAEALVELSSETRAKGLIEIITLTGFIAVALLLASPVATRIGVPFRLLVLAAVCTSILAWLPRTGTPLTRAILPVAIIVLCAAAAAITVTGTPLAESIPVQWALVCFSSAGLVATLLLHIVFRPPGLTTATASTVLLTLLVTAAGVALWDRPEEFSGPAAITVAAAMILISFVPNLAASLAGLRVPTLPTAGQDLSVSDTDLVDPTVKTQRAQTLFDAKMLGLTIVCTPLILLTAHPGTWFSTLLGLSVAVAALLHSIRHHRPIPTWALMVLACAAITTTVASAIRQDGSWAALALGVVITTATITVAVWLARIPPLEPTTIVWLERVESLCVAASLPLALHLLDVFGMLRALNIGIGG